MKFLLFFDNLYTHLGTGFVDDTQLLEIRLTEAGARNILSLADEWSEQGIPDRTAAVSSDGQTVRFLQARTAIGEPGSTEAFIRYAIDKNWRTTLLEDSSFQQWMGSTFETKEAAYRNASERDLLMPR